MKIAVSGKGGVGKTTISSAIARSLLHHGMKVLAIDADPNANLALALGMSPEEAEKIIAIAENAPLIEEKTGVKPGSGGTLFRLSFRVDDIIDRFSVNTASGVNLIVMGAVRSSGQGCMCPANALIRAILRHLLIQRGEAVIVDLEAGVEHFGRGTAEHVDIMLIVTEASLKSLETVKRVHKLSTELGIETIFVVGNKIADSSDRAMITKFCEAQGFHLLGLIPHDEAIKKSDAQGILINSQAAGFRTIQRFSEQLLHLDQDSS
jgi:CO dehydrogenase maturation factor